MEIPTLIKKHDREQLYHIAATTWLKCTLNLNWIVQFELKLNSNYIVLLYSS